MAAIQLGFTLRTSTNVKTVHLLGSWDNYAGQLPLSKDAAKAGGWKGTFRFQGATLQAGQRYWYYVGLIIPQVLPSSKLTSCSSTSWTVTTSPTILLSPRPESPQLAVPSTSSMCHPLVHLPRQPLPARPAHPTAPRLRSPRAAPSRPPKSHTQSQASPTLPAASAKLITASSHPSTTSPRISSKLRSTVPTADPPPRPLAPVSPAAAPSTARPAPSPA